MERSTGSEALCTVTVFVLALLALGLYLVLALQDVAVWKLLPLLVYVLWAQFWLLRPRRRRTSEKREERT